jgi:hypothetical protein
VEAALANGGAGAAAAALLRAAADTCPQQLLRAAATALRALLADGAHGGAARAAVVHALSAPDFPGTAYYTLALCGVLDECRPELSEPALSVPDGRPGMHGPVIMVGRVSLGSRLMHGGVPPIKSFAVLSRLLACLC